MPIAGPEATGFPFVRGWLDEASQCFSPSARGVDAEHGKTQLHVGVLANNDLSFSVFGGIRLSAQAVNDQLESLDLQDLMVGITIDVVHGEDLTIEVGDMPYVGDKEHGTRGRRGSHENAREG